MFKSFENKHVPAAKLVIKKENKSKTYRKHQSETSLVLHYGFREYEGVPHVSLYTIQIVEAA